MFSHEKRPVSKFNPLNTAAIHSSYHVIW